MNIPGFKLSKYETNISLNENITADDIDNVKIIGKITDVKYDKARQGFLVTVKCHNLDESINVLSEYPIKLLKGDSISGKISYLDDMYLFIEEPVIEPVADRKNIEGLFDIALKGIFVNERIRKKIYDFFEDETTKIADNEVIKTSAFFKTRDSHPAQVVETINTFSENFILDSESTINAIKSGTGLDEKACKRLMWWWIKNYLYRRLYMLGVMKTEIKESIERGWSLRDLYYQLLDNPYVLEKINIETCHRISEKYEKKYTNDVLQCANLVRYIDKRCDDDGWTSMPINNLLRMYPNLLPTNFGEGLIKTLIEIYKCTVKYNCIYLQYQNTMEGILTKYLVNDQIPAMAPSDFTLDRLNEKQKDALKESLSNSLTMVTGGPGTGKTTFISSLANELSRRNINYVISAFTGKAIARLKQVIDRKCSIMTMNMLINKSTELNIEYLIIDEFSMVCNSLMARVLQFLYYDLTRKKINLVLVGDYDQLPPIEPGDLMGQLLSLNKKKSSLAFIKLETDCRRKKIGPLHNNIKCIAGKRFNDLIWSDDCAYFDGQIDLVENIVTSYIKFYKDKGKSLEEISQMLTVICPFNTTCAELNLRIRKIFLSMNDKSMCLGMTSVSDSYGNTWHLYDRIMMTDNRYDINVMNGEEGMVIGVGNGFIRCKFPIGEVEIPTFNTKLVSEEFVDDITIKPLTTKLLILSWAMSVHKSQGSEWEIVIFYLPNRSSSSFINRKLIYTAMSRAKEGLVCISENYGVLHTGLITEPPTRVDNLSNALKKFPCIDTYVPTQSYAQLINQYENNWLKS